MTDQPTATPQSAKKLFYGLFIFPLVIALGMAVILCSVVLLTHERQTPETLLAGIVKVAPAKRWQKAFELSNELNRHPEVAADPAVFRPMIRILEDRQDFDPKTRGYMAIALTHVRLPEAEAALVRSVKDADDEFALYGLWALGQIQSREALPAALAYFDHATPELRKVAAYVAGASGDASAIPALTKKLNDPSVDVKWNAALALARLGNDSGWDILAGMLDRQTLERDLSGDETRIEQAMMNAIKGLILIPRPSSIKILESLSRNDKNMKVRQAAMQALNVMETIKQ